MYELLTDVRIQIIQIDFRGFMADQSKFYLIQKNNSLMAYKQSQGPGENKFILRELTSHVKSLDTIAVFDHASSESKKQHADSKIALPTFNNDRLYFTPTFILPTDQNYYRLNETFERYLFKEKIQRNLQFLKPTKIDSNQQNIRFSSPHNDFCQICQQKYDNYFEHTTSLDHQLLAKNNAINKSIQQLCSTFRANNKKKITKANKKARTNQNHPNCRKPETRLGKLRNSESNKSQSLSTHIPSF